MTEIEPNLNFVRQLHDGGASSLQKCYQCATCTTVCPLSTTGNPFPRKEMVWAQWGQMDKLINNPDVWLCHQCNDCVEYCPRDAKPGDLMAAIRKVSFAHFAVPQFMGKMLQNIKSLPYLLGFPAILILLVLIINDSFSKIKEPGIIYDKFFPMWPYIDGIFGLFFFLAVISILLSLTKFWKGLLQYTPPKEGAKGNIIGALISSAIDIAIHRRFVKCGVNKKRSLPHALVFWGFMGLIVTTTVAFAYAYGHKIGLFDGQAVAQMSSITKIFTLDPSATNPTPVEGGKKLHFMAAFVKLVIGNGSALIFIIGGIFLMASRMANKKSNATGYDWVFMAMIFMTGLTGWFSQWFRIADIGFLAYLSYYIHLICVFYIIAYFPYSKLAHLAYRFTAMVYSKYAGREVEAIIQEQEKPQAATA